MRTASLCALLSLVVPMGAYATDARPAKPEMKLNIPPYELNNQVFDFPTGLRIVMQSDRSHPVVTTWMIVNHGTKDDPEGKEETAHFVEHTWFRSKHGSLPPIMDLVQDIGSRFNATTRNDWTDFRTVASSEYLPLLLRLESLRLTEPYAGVTEQEIDIEREVIRNEWRRRNEQNIAQMFDYIYESVYPDDHPYHDHSTHASIDNIKLADLQKFMDDYYKPANTTIFVVGDFAPEEASSLIFANVAPQLLHPRLSQDDYFLYPKPGITTPDQNNPDHWLTGAYDPDSDPNKPEIFRFATREAPRITEERPPVPPVGTTEVKTKQGPFDYKTVVLGWSLPGGFRSDTWNIDLVMQFANNYIANGFVDELDQKRIGQIGCFTSQEIVNSTAICIAELKDKKLDPIYVRDKMLDQMAEMWNQENTVPNTIQGQFFASSLTRAKNQIMANLLLDLDTFAQEFGGRGEFTTPHIHYTNSVKAASEGMNQVMQADSSIMAKLAYEYLRRDRAATVILEPLPEDQIDIGSENSTYGGSNVTDRQLKSGDDLKSITDAQIAASYVVPDMSKMKDFELPNGLRVVVLPHGVAPLVQASLVFRRDSSTEPNGMFLFAGDFTHADGNDPLQIAAESNYYYYPGVPGLSPGVSYPLLLPNADIAGNSFRLSVRSPSGNLDGALWMLRETIESAKPYIDSKPRFVEDLRDELKANWADQDWHLDNARNHYLYPTAKWHQARTWEDIDTIATWGAPNVDTFLKNHFQPKNATLLIVGAIDEEEAKNLALTYFGGWQAAPTAGPTAKTKIVPDLPTEPSKILIYDDPKRTQTDLNRVCRLNVTDRNEEFAVTVLGSLVGNRVFSQMRVAEGLAYSPNAFAGVSSDLSGTLVFYSDGVVNSGIGRMVTFWDEVLAEVEAGNVNQDEITLNKLREARQQGVSAQSIGQVTNNMTGVIRNDQSWDVLTKRGDLIASVGPDDLKTLVQGCAEHAITTMVGPKDVITPQLDELGLKYEVVEWKADGDELLWKYDPKAAKKKEKDRQKAEKKKAKEAEKKKDEEGSDS